MNINYGNIFREWSCCLLCVSHKKVFLTLKLYNASVKLKQRAQYITLSSFQITHGLDIKILQILQEDTQFFLSNLEFW